VLLTQSDNHSAIFATHPSVAYSGTYTVVALVVLVCTQHGVSAHANYFSALVILMRQVFESNSSTIQLLDVTRNATHLLLAYFRLSMILLYLLY
jgi:hypothetical protein